MSYLPEIYYYGTLAPLSSVYFGDKSGQLYTPGSIASADWDFGDGSSIISAGLTDIVEHEFSSTGGFDITLSAFGFSENYGVDTEYITIYDNIFHSLAALTTESFTVKVTDDVERQDILELNQMVHQITGIYNLKLNNYVQGDVV